MVPAVNNNMFVNGWTIAFARIRETNGYEVLSPTRQSHLFQAKSRRRFVIDKVHCPFSRSELPNTGSENPERLLDCVHDPCGCPMLPWKASPMLR